MGCREIEPGSASPLCSLVWKLHLYPVSSLPLSASGPHPVVLPICFQPYFLGWGLGSLLVVVLWGPLGGPLVAALGTGSRSTRHLPPACSMVGQCDC